MHTRSFDVARRAVGTYGRGVYRTRTEGVRSYQHGTCRRTNVKGIVAYSPHWLSTFNWDRPVA